MFDIRLCFPGIQAESVNTEVESTVLIDSAKFLEIFKNSFETSDCSENEVYQDCGSKCVLSCRFASSVLEIMRSKEECEQSVCVKGCFCKEGFARHGNKCVAIAECSVQKERNNKMLEYEGKQQIFQFGPPFAQHFLQQLGQQFGQHNKIADNPRNEQYVPYGQQQIGQQQFQQFQPLGIFKHILRPGCGLGGCYSPPPPPPPSNIHIHNHNEAVNGMYSTFLRLARIKIDYSIILIQRE